jgi:hypothetical protein
MKRKVNQFPDESQGCESVICESVICEAVIL